MTENEMYAARVSHVTLVGEKEARQRRETPNLAFNLNVLVMHTHRKFSCVTLYS